MIATGWGDSWVRVKGLEGGGQANTLIVKSKSDPTVVGVCKETKHVSSKTRDRMLREVANLNMLKNAGVKVPGIIDPGNVSSSSKDPSWFVMELIAGKTLQAAIREDGRLNFDQALAVTLDLAKIIKSVHDNGILHRDVKPSNLMLRPHATADVVLLDCGLSFNENDDDTDLTRDDPIRNQFLILSEGNTPNGNRRDPRSDLTAVSGILLFCMTGQNIGYLFDQYNRPPHHRDQCTVRDFLAAGDSRARQADVFFDRAFNGDINMRLQTPVELIERLELLAKPPNNQVSDPLKEAAEYANELRKTHRKTILTGYAQLIRSNIIPAINRWFDNIVRRLAQPFSVSTGSPNPAKFASLPTGMESLPSVTNTHHNPHSIIFHAFVEYSGHSNKWLIVIRVAIQGDEGVLLASVAKDVQTKPPWEILTHFNPAELPPADEFIKHLDPCLSRALAELREDLR